MAEFDQRRSLARLRLATTVMKFNRPALPCYLAIRQANSTTAAPAAAAMIDVTSPPPSASSTVM